MVLLSLTQSRYFMNSELIDLQDYVDFWYDGLNDANRHDMHDYVYQYLDGIEDEDNECSLCQA